ncbi:ABC transporter permease [Corynebacterium breve]|uniref:ABC transporter permease n=1 Tax=Corynebacterium breve TaxID=3049799 RepID=A0ABY8VL14_9CORY|nr:ABC transporter permease [Corynebacterium breve]WIM68884.1 ABC transporter permease [Corynebacterium breve]
MNVKDIPAGTFTPAPQRASALSMSLAQGAIESKLLFRNGEQILLSLFIPIAALIATTKLPLLGEVTLDDIVPMVLAIAATSAGFTGQGISLAFDRRYGALKRNGASGVPRWTTIVGKILGVLAMAIVQVVLISLIAFVLGWRVSPLEFVLGVIALIVGVIAFTSLGLLMGGTLSSEVVLALGNLLWLVLVGIAGYVVSTGDITSPGAWIIVPSVALTTALIAAFQGSIHLAAWASLFIWTALATTAAVKWFRFDG